MQGRLIAGALLLALSAGSAWANDSWNIRLATDDDGPRAAVPVSATPFDPTSLPQERFFGRDRFSSRAVAIELVLNAIQVRHDDSLIYRPQVNDGYRISSRWRLRVTDSSASVRYEIRF